MMVKLGHKAVLFLLVSVCATWTVAADDLSHVFTRTRRDAAQAESKRTQRSRCVSCSVNGKLYDGHSRFQYEEGCNRFRCVCRCDGSWECPAKYTENICGKSAAQEGSHSQSSSSSHVSSSSSSSDSSSTAQRNDGRCRSCMINGKEQPGHTYFKHVDGCITFDNCICYCNGSWVCPADTARNTCADGKLSASGSVSRTDSRTVETGKRESGSSSSGSTFVSGGSSSSRSSFISSGSSNNSSRGGSSSSSERSSSGHGGSSSSERSSSGHGGSSSSERSSSGHSGSSSGHSGSSNGHGGSSSSEKSSSGYSGSSSGHGGSSSSERSSSGHGGSSSSSERSSSGHGGSSSGHGGSSSSERSSSGHGGSSSSERSSSGHSGSSSGHGGSSSGHGGASKESSSSDAFFRHRQDTRRTDDRRQAYGECQNCSVSGQIFAGNSYFDLQDGCRKFKHCSCYCNGSWNCPERFAETTCGTDNSAISREKTSVCRTCSVKGKTFPGNQYFQLTDGCYEYKNCICNCDGSWNCPDTGARDICNQAGGSTVDALPSSGCSQCKVKGQTFPGNQYFQLTDGCIEYKNCICNCDGSWNCPDTGAKDICTQAGKTNVDRSSCSQCQVKGQTFPGNQYFQLTDGCIEYRNCICNCDGSWNCPDTGAKDICNQAGASKVDALPSSGCSQCKVKGQTFPGNQYFQLTDGCIEYKNCICNCDGSWNCPDTGAKDICNQAGGSTVDALPSSGCSQCKVKGQTFPGNQYFQLTDGCIEYKNCICNCDGSWNCPDTGAKDICTQAGKTNVDRSSCSQCQVKGQTFPGNQYFHLTDGCIEYKNCICNCDGSWNCPDTGAKDICTQAGTTNVDRSSCSQCQVKGQTFPGNQYFQLTDGCIEYKNCICNCDGSWNCPDTGAKDICNQAGGSNVDALPSSGCSQCKVKGQTFPGNQYFQLTDGCIEYKNCICNCDGSWNCPDDGAKNTCKEKKEDKVVTSTCMTCEVYGSQFPGNQYFQVTQGCMEYRNCICHCNGTWSCPGDTAVNTCDSKRRASESVEGSDVSRTSVACLSCTAYGKNFKGGDYFDVIDGCMSYRNCICRCNGSWVCDNRFVTNVCTDETRRGTENRESHVERTDYRNASRSSSSASSTAGHCSFCHAKNKVVKGNTYFELTDGCTEYKNCLCKCDGTWDCPSQYTKNICIETDQTAVSTGISSTTCANCVAKGKIVKGNSYFELIDGCTRYTSCRCNCEGKWECPEQRAQNICFNNTTVSDSGCSLCQSSDGLTHQPNSRFQLTENCIEYNCDCFCNGSWSCPGKRSRWVCHDKCLECDVNGRKVQNNTQFVHKTGCLEYTCNCHCNGSWSCAGNTARNTCPVEARDGCNKCRVSSTEVYDGESDFVLKQGCLHYKCRCNCDGGYTCPGKEARNVCRGEVIGGCRSCAVSETEIHKGETEFTMRKDCINFECKCNCNGSWECPSEKARNVCLGEVPGGCRACRVSETEVYRANSVFDMRKDCIHYKCKCNCDGSWSCPGEDARDICKGEIPGGCRSCVVADEFYPGNTNFEMVKNCIHYKCRCNCDGGYSCPGQTARRVCQAGAGADAATCRTCRVSESEQFTGNSTFHIERGCARYECECKCDGSWHCPLGKTHDICARGAVKPTTPSRCTPCKISNDVYPGNTAFKFTRGCSQFDCKCDCSGRWSCDHKNRVNVCRGGEQATTERSLISDASALRRRQDFSASNSDQVSAQSSQRGSTIVETDIRSQEGYSSQSKSAFRTNSTVNTVSTSSGSNIDSNCRQCYADGRTIQPNTVFSLDRGCLQYRNCKCHCDGRWQCPEELNRCETTQSPFLSQGERSHRTETQSSSSTSSRRREVDSSGWVFVDGVDSSYKTSDDRTGGGYVVQVDTKYSPKYSTRGQGRQRLDHLGLNPSSSSSSGSSSSSSSSSTFLTSGSSPDTSSASSSRTSMVDENKGTNQCLRCQVDTKTYPSGANFDMRRGCVVYKCLCLCSGSYRCRLTSDNECSVQDKQGSCSNCLYQGMVFPGNMGFTVREGCEEKQCTCNCDGTHACHSTKPIPGCADAAVHAAGVPGQGNFYPVPGGLVPISTGYVTNTGRAVYQSSCTTCVDQGSGPVVYHAPVHPAAGEGGGGFTSTEHRFSVDQGLPRETCSGCLIDGQLREGNSTFTFNKECIEFDCYCACSGSWKCAGRLAIDCTPGFAPETVPHIPGCRSCNVQGTAYPANTRFSLRQGCHEYQCSCNCDGGWSCPAQHPVNLCPSAPPRPARGNVMDPQIIRDDAYLADQGMVNNEETKHGQLRHSANPDRNKQKEYLNAIVNTCYECEVRGVTYQAKSKFFLREGCIQRICECHCNKSWSCLENTIDICKITASEASAASSGQCRDCHVGSDVYVSGNDFQINNACYQHNCYCYCNGTHVCPAERIRNICNPDSNTPVEVNTNSHRSSGLRIQPSILTKENGEVIVAGKVPGCKECNVDGQRVEALSTFVKQLGCYESICHCQCNGNAACPPSASVNVCELPDKLPMNERKGCQVGRRTHLTRVFAHIENCIQRTCLCHDNGEWSCKRTANDLKVC